MAGFDNPKRFLKFFYGWKKIPNPKSTHPVSNNVLYYTDFKYNTQLHDRTHSMVRTSPFSRGTFGSHPKISFAFVMSGRLLMGSSSGNGWKDTGD
jgi:hypothetical protein